MRVLLPVLPDGTAALGQQLSVEAIPPSIFAILMKPNLHARGNRGEGNERPYSGTRVKAPWPVFTHLFFLSSNNGDGQTHAVRTANTTCATEAWRNGMLGAVQGSVAAYQCDECIALVHRAASC